MADGRKVVVRRRAGPGAVGGERAGRRQRAGPEQAGKGAGLNRIGDSGSME